MFKKNTKNIIRVLGIVFTWGVVQISTIRAASVTCSTGVERELGAAESGIWKGLTKCRVCGDCKLNDFIQLGINIFDYVLGIVGALALLAFVYGGILFLFSAGNSEQIEKGKKVLTGAVIGLFVIFTSYMIINFIAQSLGVDSNILNADWF